MYITTDITNFTKKNVFLHEPVKNIMKSGCEFMKIMYSNNIFVMNGVYVDISLKNVEIQKRKESYRIKIDNIHNNDLLNLISRVELDILDLLPDGLCRVCSLNNDNNKARVLKKYSDIELKPGTYDKLTCTLRIFGVWKDSTKCGLNYQYIIS